MILDPAFLAGLIFLAICVGGLVVMSMGDWI